MFHVGTTFVPTGLFSHCKPGADGVRSESGVAIFNVVYSASFLVLYLFNAVAEAAQPLISTFAGESSDEDARMVFRLSLWWGMIAGGVAAALVFLLAERICGMFGLAAALLKPGRGPCAFSALGRK